MFYIADRYSLAVHGNGIFAGKHPLVMFVLQLIDSSANDMVSSCPAHDSFTDYTYKY
jgi:hypothetical protein